MRVRYSFSSRHTRTIALTNRHHRPIPTLIKEIIRISDIVLEVLDARFIDETRNKELEDMILGLGKKIIFVLNKADLIDVVELKKNIDLEGLKPYVLVSCKTKAGIRELRTRIKIESKKIKQEKSRHIGIIGYPNTGKSSIINVLAGGGRARTAAAAGFTKGMQKIRLAKGILLLDSPGVMPEKEAPAHKTKDAQKLSIIGVKTFDRAKNPEFVVFELMKKNSGVFEKFYKINANRDSERLIEEFGRKNKLLKKGGEVDIDRAARRILKDWQFGKIKI
ncbi:50S ribosome-binding GTPase [Candidatus Pacearchaeota archaeon]|nr:50S ribosome-binding GTPase [Candidatus Pacearchaeota archaeon]